MLISLTAWTATAVTALRGETTVITVLVTDPETGDPVDLDAGAWAMTAVEFQVKPAVEAPDPPVIGKSLGAGIVKLTQSGETLGKLQVTLQPADTSGTVLPGRYQYDVVGTFTTQGRLYVCRPATFQLNGTVNQV